MEPGIKELFKRLAVCISLLVLWMLINMTFGIWFGWAYFEGGIDWYNVVFYLWALLSFAALIWYYVYLWKKPIEGLKDEL